MMEFPFPIRYSMPLIMLLFVFLLSLLLMVREVNRSGAEIELSMLEDARFTGIQTSTILENLYQRELNHVVLSVVSQLAVKPYLTRALIIDDAGRIISSTAYEHLNQQLDPSMIALPLSQIEAARKSLSSFAEIDRDSDTLTAAYPFMLSIKDGSIRAHRIGILYFEYDLSIQKQGILNMVSRIFFESFLLFFMLCFLVFLFLNRTISLRVYRLLEVAKRFSEGNLRLRSALKGSDELADISRAFDQMAADIELKNNELHSAKDELECRVEQRTAELNNLTRQLSSAKDVAESASEAKSQFLARMSHEIRTPMHAIISMTGFVLKTDLTDKQKEYLQVVKVSSENLLIIINDILDFSKIEAGKMEIEAIDFDLYSTLEMIIKNHQPLAEAKQLNLKITAAEDTPRFVNGDPVRFSQVLSNLISNAIKFTDTGSVKVYVKPSDGGKISFSVNDTGNGIPEDKIGHIFDSFMQADSSTTRKYGGTGLGLAISRQLVELMGGEINVTSRQGMGSSFVFTIGFAEAKFKTPLSVPCDQTPVPGQHPAKGLKILLAEDDPVNVKVASVFIDDLGWTMAHAENGKMALNFLSEEKFDLVLMDVSMPDMDGLEACRRLRDGEAGDININTPVIAITAHALTGFRDKCLSAGMNDYISKPVDFVKLQSIIACLTGSGFEPSDHEADINTCDDCVLDFQPALKRLNGNQNLYKKLMSIYLSNMPQMLLEIENAVTAGAKPQTAKIAHKYKGSSSTVGAAKILKAVLTIESWANDNNAEKISEGVSRLKSEAAAFETEAKKFLSSLNNN